MYKHYLLYTIIDNKKAAATLLDKYHVVTCMHEIPLLQQIRESLNQLFAGKAIFEEDESPNPMLKDSCIADIELQIAKEEERLKYEASKRYIEFYDCQGNRHISKIEFYNWQHDFCIMKLNKAVPLQTNGIGFCSPGKEYIALVSLPNVN